jgi:hypothetical protein
MLQSIFKKDIKIIKVFENGRSKEKPVLFEVNGREFVFKYIAENKRDADYFINMNDFMTQNGLSIHTIFMTERFSNGTYGVFEYFENFITEPFKDYHKMGQFLAKVDNIVSNYTYNYSPQNENKIEMFKRCIKNNYQNIFTDFLKNNTAHLILNEQYFERLHNHFDFNFGNIDKRFRIIDIGNAHYGWRIDNFLSILYINGFKSKIKGENALLDAISGYNLIAARKLNYFEITGIFDIVAGYTMRANILNRPSNILETNLKTLNNFKIAI